MASGSGLPNQTLERFAQAARDETDLEALTAELVSVVQTTMQPAEVGGWLRSIRAVPESTRA